MAALLIVAHEPLASTLLAVARHTYADCGSQVSVVDVPAALNLLQATDLVAAALDALPGDVLILADVFGATPCNAALQAAGGQRARVVVGVNVPMLWRTLCYADLPLAELVTRATDGGHQGIMQVSAPHRQNQPKRPPSDDPDANSNQ